MNIGHTIDAARKRVGMGKEEFARRCGLKSAESIRLIVQNRRVPTAKTLEKILKAGKIPQEEAIALREDCMVARAVKAGFDIHMVSEKVWDRFTEALMEEGISEEWEVDMDHLKDAFMESITRFLVLE